MLFVDMNMKSDMIDMFQVDARLKEDLFFKTAFFEIA